MSHKKKRQNRMIVFDENRYWSKHDEAYIVEFGGQPNCMITCRAWHNRNDAIRLALMKFGFTTCYQYIDCYPGHFDVQTVGHSLFKITTRSGTKKIIDVCPIFPLDNSKNHLTKFLEHAIVAPTVQAVKHCGCKLKYRDLWFCSDFGKKKIGK